MNWDSQLARKERLISWYYYPALKCGTSPKIQSSGAYTPSTS